MAQPKSPSSFDNLMELVFPETGVLTDIGLNRLVELWRQVCAGFVNVPCIIDQTSVNALKLTPSLNKEGGASYDLKSFLEGRLTESSQNLYAEAIEFMERYVVMRVLQTTGGNQSRAAKILGITRGSLRNKIRTLGISIAKSVWWEDDQGDS